MLEMLRAWLGPEANTMILLYIMTLGSAGVRSDVL